MTGVVVDLFATLYLPATTLVRLVWEEYVLTSYKVRLMDCGMSVVRCRILFEHVWDWV